MKTGKRKNMIQNRKKQIWGTMCLCLCLLTACQQEIGTEPDPSEGGMFLMYNSDVKPLAGTTDKVRVIVFAGENDTGPKTFVSNKVFTGTSGKIPLQGAKYQDIYTIINEEKSLENIRTLEQLQQVKINENLSPEVNTVQRYHYYHNIYARNDGSGVILDGDGVDISKKGLTTSEYTAAKVKVEFDLTPSTADGIELKFTGAKLTEVPAYSFLLPRTYDGAVYAECDLNLPSHSVGALFRDTAELVVPEYWPAGDRVMMLVIQADRYREGSRLGSSEYRFPVGNSMSGGSDNKVDRNKVYKFRFTAVTGMGIQIDDWKVDKKVVGDWEEQSVSSEVGDAYGFFLQVEQLDNFRSFRLPRYVNFRAEGPGQVWIDKPRFDSGDTVAPNEFVVRTLWDDNTHKSGRLELQLGNWQVGKVFSVHIKMRANNIERTLVINSQKTRFASSILTGLTWSEAMGYTPAVNFDFMGTLLTQDRMLEEYSKNGNTGCASYYEGTENDPLTGKGCWRVSTIREGLLYMEANKMPVESRFWAYEIVEVGNSNSYTSRYYKTTPLPPLNNNLNPSYYTAESRGQTIFYTPSSQVTTKILCVQDDKLDRYYNLEVNNTDNREDVSYSLAQTVCSSIPDDGKGTWRLPTSQEAADALQYAGTKGIPNNFNAGLYWLSDGMAVGPANPQPHVPGNGRANVRCVRKRWQ